MRVPQIHQMHITTTHNNQMLPQSNLFNGCQVYPQAAIYLTCICKLHQRGVIFVVPIKMMDDPAKSAVTPLQQIDPHRHGDAEYQAATKHTQKCLMISATEA